MSICLLAHVMTLGSKDAIRIVPYFVLTQFWHHVIIPKKKGFVKSETKIKNRIFRYEYKCSVCGTGFGNSDGILYKSCFYENAQRRLRRN